MHVGWERLSKPKLLNNFLGFWHLKSQKISKLQFPLNILKTGCPGTISFNNLWKLSTSNIGFQQFNTVGCTGWPHFWETKFPEFSWTFANFPWANQERKINSNTLSLVIMSNIFIFPEFSRFFPAETQISLGFPWDFDGFQIPWIFQVFHVFHVSGHPVTESQYKQGSSGMGTTCQWNIFIKYHEFALSRINFTIPISWNCHIVKEKSPFTEFPNFLLIICSVYKLSRKTLKNSQHMHCIKGDIFYNSDHFFSFYKQVEKQGLGQKPGINMMLKIMLET